MENISCVVKRITYHNPDNGYTILRAESEGQNITVVCTLPKVTVGTALKAEGEWKTHPTYGLQFSANKCSEQEPVTIQGIEKYLSGGLFKGIGAGYAKKIVAQFGVQTLTIIEKYPERLAEVKGLGKSRIQKIRESWSAAHEVQDIMVFLQGYNVTPGLAVKIYKQYGKDAISIVKQNPYRLADEVWGIGFKSADSLAMNIGIEKENPFRISSGLLYTLGQLATEGHVYAEWTQLVEKASELLEVQPKVIEEVIQQMIDDTRLIEDGTSIYLPLYYYAERGTAKRLNALMAYDVPACSVSVSDIEQKLGKTFDEAQAEAILTAMRSKVMVLTGLPGTGKTTTIQGIIEGFETAGLHVVLAAPTGRAAKRMTEATGRGAKTIHRMLEYRPTEGFTRNEDNPLEGDVLIVDECSMIDMQLMSSLTKAIPPRMRLILVGDTNQLPSVGAGNVLNDIIASKQFPVICLTKIFRQALTSQIVLNSHRINAGQMPDLSNQNNTDFWFIEKEDPTEIANEIVALVSKRLPDYCNVDPKDIQVLTPMKKSPIGTDALNAALQETLNPGGMCLKQGNREFRKNDRVMQIRNNYDKDVFNGDVGIVTQVDLENKEIIVSFDGMNIPYEFSELDELVHAYAVTIHKSQGSEYPIVVMPISMQHYIMLQRNLIYTGITRAKKMIVLVGTKKAVGHSVRNLTVSKRNTHLEERLRAE